jgi:hypothetical protein
MGGGTGAVVSAPSWALSPEEANYQEEAKRARQDSNLWPSVPLDVLQE